MTTSIGSGSTDTAGRESYQDFRRELNRIIVRWWGIYDDELFREDTIKQLEQSLGAKLETRMIADEFVSVIVSNGQHILVEIVDFAKRDALLQLEHKRRLYREATGITPARVIYAVASVNSRLAQSLREAGIEVIEPEAE